MITKEMVFNNVSFLSVDDAIEDIKFEISACDQQMCEANEQQAQLLTARRNFLLKFIDEIRKLVLFPHLEPWWAYRYTMDHRGATLELFHVNPDTISSYNEKGYLGDLDSIILLLSIDARISGISMSCESNQKHGSIKGLYEWYSVLYGVPEGMEYIKEPAFAFISQDEENEGNYKLVLGNKATNESQEYSLDREEKERLEVYLDGNHQVHVVDREVIYSRKRGCGSTK